MRVFVLPLLLAAAAVAQDEGGLTVKPLAPDPARDARIEELIAQLLKIEKPYDGITCSSGGGVGFDALRANEDTPPAFRELVRLGPAAMPALLKHLDDKRETKLSLSWVDEDMGSRMFARPEIPAMSPEERVRIRRVLGPAAEKEGPVDAPLVDQIESHAVTVGDCCFVILGQIVNRSYEAVRYQPSLLAIVSSPTREPRIAKVLRGRWGRGDPRQILAESLLYDFRQRKRPGMWPGAAERLLVFFPEFGDEVVARRIGSIRWDDGFEEYCGHELLRRVLPTGRPRIRAAWLDLLGPDRAPQTQLSGIRARPEDAGDDFRDRVRALRDRPSDVDVVVVCVAVLNGEKAPATFAWLKGEFPKVETRDAERTRAILAALAALDEDESLPIFRAHIEKLAEWGWGNAIVALRETPRANLAAALFRAKLDATDPVGPHVVPAPEWVTGETRWCDLAAAVIAHARLELGFDPKATVEERDRRIAAIRAALAK
ncbi:MAG TPA: hypothetical protein VFY93_16675 [Planctomycetota bacterium]|nr:hypothetical protein [Planctomycetota bacterium]